MDYDTAVEFLDRLAILDERTEDQEDYVETLSGLVERYDDEHFALKDSDISPIESLRYLCEQNGMIASALGVLLGNRSLGSQPYAVSRSRRLASSLAYRTPRSSACSVAHSESFVRPAGGWSV